MSSKYLQLAVCLYFSLSLTAQDLLPFVENYSKSDYQGDNQIWNVSQGTDKAMYFANNHYFLRYDGVRWEKYTLPDKTIIRSIYVSGDRIYSGSYKEFGYWTRREGQMHYRSLSHSSNIFDENANEEIWKIFQFKGDTYFQSFNEIFVLSNNKVRKVKLPFQISYCFIVGDDLLFASIAQGIYTWKDAAYAMVPGYEQLNNNIVHHIEKIGGATYFFTQRNGVFIAQNNRLQPWQHPLNETLKAASINTAKFIASKKVVIGTASNGAYIVDLDSDKYTHFERTNVLRNNSVLSIAIDGEGDLWLGLDNGIAHIEINSPVEIFSDNSGQLGSVYSLAPLPSGYLLASNHGVFKYSSGELSQVPGSQGQAWDIRKFGHNYLIGHNEGTFTYRSGIFSKLNTVNGGWNFTPSTISDAYLQSTYCGVVVYPTVNNLTRKYEIRGLCKPIKYAVQNQKHEIWAADNYRGLYKINYGDNYSTTSIENVTGKSNMANDFGVKIFGFRGQLLFLIDRKWYTYNPIAEKLESHALFNRNFEGVSDIAAISDSNFLVLSDGLLYLVQADGEHFNRTLIQEKYYAGKIINDNLKVVLHGDRYLLNLDDGFISLGLQQTAVKSPKIKVEAYYDGVFFKNDSGIKYNTGLVINVISGKYGSARPNLFYKKNGKGPILPVRNGSIVLNNLESGKQHIGIFYFDGAAYIHVAKFEFAVERPWYFSISMILVYIVIIAAACWLYYRWNSVRYNQKLQLREEELRHQKDILELQLKAENELNSQEYEKHILELELQAKSSEVAGKSLSIAKQGEIIESIKAILDAESDVEKIKSEIHKAIRINAVNKHEWEVFESNLNQIHNEFIIRLTERHPNISSKDVKLCIYLKMNLSSKEIAPLMNISFRGVELHRYRLRKKLGLTPDESLYRYMTSLY